MRSNPNDFDDGGGARRSAPWRQRGQERETVRMAVGGRRGGADCGGDRLHRLQPVADDAVLAVRRRAGARRTDAVRVMVVENEARLTGVVDAVVQKRRHRHRHAAHHDEQREQRETAAVTKNPEHFSSSVSQPSATRNLLDPFQRLVLNTEDTKDTKEDP